MVSIKVKWGKTDFDLLIDQANRQSVLSMICERTRIPHDKIKVIPASILNPQFALKEGMKVTVIGTAEDQQLVAPAPEQVTQFIEDMTPDEIAAALRLRKADPLPLGFENLGNTCFLNAVVQSLIRLPEFRQHIITSTNSDSIISQLKSLLLALDSHSATDSFTPAMFVATIRSRFPQFNQRDNHGHYAQQDAEEFLRALLQSLHETDPLFSFTLESVWRCLESETEPLSTMVEEHKTLTCHMGTQLEPVSHLHDGVQLSLKETITKEAATLGNKSVQFEKKSGISSLPPYLVVQFARFQWKAKSDSAGTEATKTKITRRVTFQKTLDVYDFCSDSIRADLDLGRERRRQLLDGGALIEDVQVADVIDQNDKIRLPTGVYELLAIVSHQGRTSDGGHYIAWTKRPRRKEGISPPIVDGPPVKKQNGGAKPDEDPWVKFDDDVVSETNWAAMTEAGGIMGGLADSQMAYLLFYAKTTVEGE
jgi:ubiquitin carboxyl-terminal hydrolase 14